jgi:hypothetical protein
MPCKNGTRDAIEAGRRRRQEEREGRSHPLTGLWHDLVHRVHQTSRGFAALSEPEQLYFAVGALDGAVYRGGFESYFFNSTGDYYKHAKIGLEIMGANQALTLLLRAKQVLFAFEEVPEAIAERRRKLIVGGDTPSRNARLQLLDQQYCANPDDLPGRLEAFARARELLRSTI